MDEDDFLLTFFVSNFRNFRKSSTKNFSPLIVGSIKKRHSEKNILSNKYSRANRGTFKPISESYLANRVYKKYLKLTLLYSNQHLAISPKIVFSPALKKEM